MIDKNGDWPESQPPPQIVVPPQHRSRNHRTAPVLTPFPFANPTPDDGAGVVGYQLPLHVFEMFSKPVGTGELSRRPEDELLIAGWLAALGWSDAQILAFVEDRDRDCARRGFESSVWERRATNLETPMAIGRWQTHGLPTAGREGLLAKINQVGVPLLGLARLHDYLCEVRLAFEVSPRTLTYGTDILVLAAALDIAEKAGTIAPALAVRRIGPMANKNKETVSASLRRLVKAGFLLPYGDTRGRTTRSYVLRAPTRNPYIYLVSRDSGSDPGVGDH